MLAAVVSALLAAGCGGGQSGTSQIKNTVNAVFLSHNVSACTQSVTKHFLQSTYDKDPQKALKACEKSQIAANNAANTLSFQGINIKKDKAIATVKIFGGTLNGRTLTAVLVNDHGWKFDTLQARPALPSDAELRATIDAALNRALVTEQGYKRKQAACFVSYLQRKVSDAQLAADLNALKARQTAPDFAAAAAACKK